MNSQNERCIKVTPAPSKGKRWAIHIISSILIAAIIALIVWVAYLCYTGMNFLLGNYPYIALFVALLVGCFFGRIFYNFKSKKKVSYQVDEEIPSYGTVVNNPEGVSENVVDTLWEDGSEYASKDDLDIPDFLRNN